MTTQLKDQIVTVLDNLPDQLAAQVLDFAWFIKKRHAHLSNQIPAGVIAKSEDVWDFLDVLTGTIDAPTDWAVEHDHYLYATPKQFGGESSE